MISLTQSRSIPDPAARGKGLLLAWALLGLYLFGALLASVFGLGDDWASGGDRAEHLAPGAAAWLGTDQLGRDPCSDDPTGLLDRIHDRRVRCWRARSFWGPGWDSCPVGTTAGWTASCFGYPPPSARSQESS